MSIEEMCRQLLKQAYHDDLVLWDNPPGCDWLRTPDKMTIIDLANMSVLLQSFLENPSIPMGVSFKEEEVLSPAPKVMEWHQWGENIWDLGVKVRGIVRSIDGRVIRLHNDQWRWSTNGANNQFGIAPSFQDAILACEKALGIAD